MSKQVTQYELRAAIVAFNVTGEIDNQDDPIFGCLDACDVMPAGAWKVIDAAPKNSARIAPTPYWLPVAQNTWRAQ